jgi:Zn-dependent protease with chaperone function
MTCPQCGAAIPPGGGFVNWCEVCDWNVDPSPPPEPKTTRARKEQARRQREHERYRDYAAGIEPLTKAERAALVAPTLIAVVILLGTTLVFAAGVFLLVTLPWILGVPLGLMVIGIAVILRPRLGRVPRGPSTFRRGDLPELFALLDDVCEAAHAKPIDVVVLDRDFNAAATRLGIGQRRVLVLGVPLWLALDPQPRVAVLGHEVGHFVNGDVRRSLLVGSSIRTLTDLVDALGPVQYAGGRYAGVSAHLVDAFLALLAIPLRGLRSLQLRLTRRSHRVAEHAADALGAEIASTEASVEALEAALLLPAFQRALEAAVRQNDGSLWDYARMWRGETPPREQERLRRLGRQRLACSDETHPPTVYRIEALQTAAPRAALVTLDAERAARVDAEILGKSQDVERWLRSSSD